MSLFTTLETTPCFRALVTIWALSLMCPMPLHAKHRTLFFVHAARCEQCNILHQLHHLLHKYGTSHKKVNVLCLFVLVRVCCVLRYRRCVGHIVQLKSKQDGGIRSARQF